MSDPRILKFNTIAGKPPVDTTGSVEKFWEELENQVERVHEEAKEMLDWVRKRNFKEVVDGWVDTWFTNDFIEDQLRAIGVNTVRIKDNVCDNNLSKFLQNPSYAKDCARLMDGVVVREVEYDGEKYFVLIHTEDNKVMKPLDYKGPNILEAIPSGVWEFLGGDSGCKEQ